MERAQKQANPGEKPTFLLPEYVAEDLGFSVFTLRAWRGNGTGPPHCIVGGRIRYPSDLYEQWRAEVLATAK